MDISMIAKLKGKEEFYSNYSKDDINRLFNGKSLLFYALSNNNIEVRYDIVNFLLDEGAKANVINENQETLLHILLSRNNHNLEQTIKLSERLINSGVDINKIDDKGRLALQCLINMKYTDKELEPLYELWFSQPNICINVKNSWGKTLLDIARTMPYRKELVERMQKYE